MNTLMLFSIAIAGMLYGYDIGVINGVFLFVQRDIPMDTYQLSTLAAAVLGGGALSTLIAGPAADWLGRKRLIQFACIFFIFGVLEVVMAHSYSSLLTGRLIQGIGVGIVSIVVPLYLAESMPTNLRGRGVVSFQVLLTLGIAIATASGLIFIGTGNWRGMFLTAIVPAILLLIFSFLVKESPRWLALKGRYSHAYDALRKVNSHYDTTLELKSMKKKTRSSLRPYLIPLCIVCAIGILNQLTGINIILQFSAIILKGSGLHSNLTSLFGGSGIAVVNVLLTLVAFSVVDRFERKHLVAFGTVGIVIALSFCALVYRFVPASTFSGYLILAGLMVYIGFFAIGPGALIWSLMSELLPSQVRATGMAIALFLNSGASAILATVFLPTVAKIGYGGAFAFFAVSTLIYLFVAIKFIPKTRGQTLEEIERSYE